MVGLIKNHVKKSWKTLFVNFFNYLNLIFVSRNLLSLQTVVHFSVAFETSCKYT